MPTLQSKSCTGVSDVAQQHAIWNSTSQPYPTDLRVHELVSRHAEATPDALAVAKDAELLTYRELEQRSNRMARHLRALGVGPDVLVGLCVDRSPLMVVGALAILKAGGAYVPMDPSYPQERITFMLDDARPRVLVTQASFVQQLSAHGPEIVVLDREGPQIVNQSPGPLVDAGSTNDLAYVIYTSGSTGQPKGVEITHAGLLNLVFWHLQAFDIKPSDRASQVASLGFDAAVWEIWPYLVAGASVHFADEMTRSQPESLRDWMVTERITTSFVPTPLAERMIHLSWPPTAALRLLLTGADTLHHYPPDGLPFLLVNNYGPTECTVVATSGPVLHNDRPEKLPPIGRPIANTQIYILDDELHAKAIGAPGELYIGGAGLARGYLNQPELTREKFVPNPFNGTAGARLYRTGDLARYLPDGQIIFLGRVDEQVKVRGFRIEPNEVVRVLNLHPAIRASAVVAREDTPGEKRLVAYIVPVPGTFVTNSDLRDFLIKEVPAFMLPAVFVQLDSLPLSPSGKVDRSALPAPNDQNIARECEFITPRTPTEERVAAILARLLDLERVGVNDNFFLLGGNSLLGTQVIAHVRDSFDVELTLLSLFDHPTVAGIAAEVEQLILTKLDAMSEEEVQRLVAESDKRVEQ